jgi:hypothetical protein
MNNDILVFDTIKQENVTSSELSETSDKNTLQDEVNDDDQEQNWSSVDLIQRAGSSIEVLDTLRKPECFATNSI